MALDSAGPLSDGDLRAMLSTKGGDRQPWLSSSRLGVIGEFRTSTAIISASFNGCQISVYFAVLKLKSQLHYLIWFELHSLMFWLLAFTNRASEGATFEAAVSSTLAFQRDCFLVWC